LAIDTCVSLGVTSAARSPPHPGVWIGQNKVIHHFFLASYTTHGFASHKRTSSSASPSKVTFIGKHFQVCAVGVRNAGLVVSHGIALNCNVNLKWFDHVVPCGIEDRGVTSLSEFLGHTLTTEEAVPALLKAFKALFNCHLVEESPPKDLLKTESEILSQIVGD